MTTPPPLGVLEVECPGCGVVGHEACYSHEGQFGEGPVYAVACPDDGLTSYFTLEVVALPE